MENRLTLDRASYRNRQGWAQKAITAYKLRRHFSTWGDGNLVRSKTQFWLTDGAQLTIGHQSTILDYAFFQLTKPAPRVWIGSRSVIGRHCMITAKSLIQIGDDVLMGAYVQVIDHNHGFAPGSPIREQPATIAPVVIGNDVWIGAGAKILAGVRVGEGAVIGSNAVVTRDVPANAIMGGIPARLIRFRNAVEPEFPADPSDGVEAFAL